MQPTSWSTTVAFRVGHAAGAQTRAQQRPLGGKDESAQMNEGFSLLHTCIDFEFIWSSAIHSISHDQDIHLLCI